MIFRERKDFPLKRSWDFGIFTPNTGNRTMGYIYIYIAHGFFQEKKFELGVDIDGGPP